MFRSPVSCGGLLLSSLVSSRLLLLLLLLLLLPVQMQMSFSKRAILSSQPCP
jgi:hypothetical protein